MFKKIISQLSFSPVTVEQMGIYAKKTRKRQNLYGWSIVVLSLLLLAQIGASIIPVSPSTTPTANDLIPGGVPSKETLLSAYENNLNGFRDTADLFGITQQHLESAAVSKDCSLIGSTSYTTGRQSHLAAIQEHSYLAPDKPIYVRSVAQNTQLTGWCGESNSGPFIINSADGNIISSSLPAKQEIAQEFTRSLVVDTRDAEAGKTITWDLTIMNTSDKTTTEDIWFSTGDIAEYAHITTISNDGIDTDSSSYILWPAVTLNPNERQTLKVLAYVDHNVDATSRQSHNTNSYDCQLTASFGNTTETDVACPITKQLEGLFYQLPVINPAVPILINLLLLIFSIVAYASLRLQSRELRIIRKQLNTGGI